MLAFLSGLPSSAKTVALGKNVQCCLLAVLDYYYSCPWHLHLYQYQETPQCWYLSPKSGINVFSETGLALPGTPLGKKN